MSYDPESMGARCGECPLRTLRAGGPVPPEWPASASPLALIVGEAPGGEEVKQGRPFVGPSGVELDRALRAAGTRRSAFAVTNALLCRPTANDLRGLLHALASENKRRVARGEAPRPSPIECCAPRLAREALACPRVVTLGAVALQAVTGHGGSILEVRGGPRELVQPGGDPPARVLPTLHPAFVARARRWRGAFRADLGRAVRWFTTGLAWRDPERFERPDPAWLAAWLERHAGDPFLVCDLETFAGFPEVRHYDPLFDRLGLIGIGTWDAREAVIVPFRSLESGAGFYTEAEQIELLAILRAFFTSNRWRKVGHNFAYYDRQVVEAQIGVTPAPLLDTIALHKLAEPELPHSLGYVGSIHTDVSAWKAGHLATDATTDLEWWRYNATDLAVTALAVPGLERAARERGQLALLPTVAKIQALCVGLHRNGLAVNEARRLDWDSRLVLEARAALTSLRTRAGNPSLNPSSTAQLRTLLFSDLEIQIHHYTDTGEPSTDDESLRAFLSAGWSLPERERQIVQAVRAYRRKIKMRGTYVVKLRPIEDRSIPAPILAWDEEETPEEREARFARHATIPGLTIGGRVHPDYNAHGTMGWRLSSSNPNAQNMPSRLREMIVPGPGRVFVGCDEAQLELRMIAGLSRSAVYLEAFNRGEDPHRALCLDFFGDTFKAASADQKKALRVFCKQFTYGACYGAGAETIHSILTSAEDENDRLLYPDLTLRETGAFHEKWLRRNPEIVKWWEDTIEEWRARHYLEDPILGLRVDFLDGEDRSKLVNFKPQVGGAALVHLATFRILDRLARVGDPYAPWGPGTGLVHQGHDSLMIECPESEAEWVAKMMTECMREDGKLYGLPLPFLGETKIGRTWKDA